MKPAPAYRRAWLTVLVTLVILLVLWRLTDNWYHTILVAEAEGQQNLVDRSIFIFRVSGLVIVALLTLLTYVVTSRHINLSQTIKSQTKELTERLEQYRRIFETTHEALVIRDMETLVIVDANPAYCQLRGMTREALIGQASILASDVETYRTYVDIVKQTGKHGWEGTIPTADGGTIYLEAVGTPISILGRPHLLVALRDITERTLSQQVLEQRVAKRTHELEMLLRVSRDLTETLDLKTLLSDILRQLGQLVDYDNAIVVDLVDDDHLDLLQYTGPLPFPDLLASMPLIDFPYREPIIHQQQPYIIPDTQADTPEAQVWRETLGRTGGDARAWMGVPLVVKNRTTGLLAFGHHQANIYTSHHASLAMIFANQAAIAIENARLYEQAQTLASLEERRHLARELHDSVSQALYGIALGTRTARMLLDRDPSKLAEPLDYIMNLAEAGLSEMRALIFELRPEILEAEGLVAVLTKQSEALEGRHKLTVITHFDQEPQVPLAVKEAFYRIAQEATHNIVKHAKAGRIELWLTSTEMLTLTITDDGQGFDPQQTFPGHLGLQSMRERVERLGGRFELESKPDQGTTIRVQVLPPAGPIDLKEPV